MLQKVLESKEKEEKLKLDEEVSYKIMYEENKEKRDRLQQQLPESLEKEDKSNSDEEVSYKVKYEEVKLESGRLQQVLDAKEKEDQSKLELIHASVAIVIPLSN